MTAGADNGDAGLPAGSNGTTVRLDGSVVRAAAGEPEPSDGPGPEPVVAGGVLDDLEWHASYDRESVDRYLAAVEEEKARLLVEIELADERTAAAEARCRVSVTEQSTERDALLGELMLAARAEMERVETEQRAIVSAIHALAEEQAAGITTRAAADAAAVRGVVTALGELDAPAEEPTEDGADVLRRPDEDHAD